MPPNDPNFLHDPTVPEELESLYQPSHGKSRRLSVEQLLLERKHITEEQLKRTFQTNVFGMFFLTQAALPHLKEGSAIVNCTSETTYKGSPGLLDYSSTKGAIVGFTRSLAKNLVKKGIRVNGVAPGPIWTPLNPSGGQPPEKIPEFGKDTPMGRPGQPNEVAPSFLFLACEDSSYMTGQVLHPDGGNTSSS